MKHVIEDFYAKAKIPTALLGPKIEKLRSNKDVLEEFEYWITHRKYKADGIEINGYSAQKLAMLSRFLDGEGAFMLLIELRENPEKAMKRIKQGFKLK